MKKLLLIRHAKAVHDLNYDDFERPLKLSGIKDAELMAVRLKANQLIPQQLVASPALRTRSTADIFAAFLSLPGPLLDTRIYEAGPITLLEVINEFNNQYDFIALVGHNPTMEQIVSYLCNVRVEFPTCAIALLEFELDDWAEISAQTGNLSWFSEPKED